MVKIILEIDFPSLNEVINTAKKGGKGAGYAALKKNLTNKVRLLANNQYKAQKSPKFKSKICFLFQWYAKNQMKDPDNIEFATKFILDGFKNLGLYEDDSYKITSGLKLHSHHIDKKRPRVEIYIQEHDDCLEDQMINLFKDWVQK